MFRILEPVAETKTDLPDLGGERREVLNVKAVAGVLGCSVSHASNILRGKVPGLPPIPHVRAGRLRLVRREALMRWFQDREAETGKR
jgi:hypothetical protein